MAMASTSSKSIGSLNVARSAITSLAVFGAETLLFESPRRCAIADATPAATGEVASASSKLYCML